MTKIYIAGPMTGLPDLNYPAFHAAAAALRAQGHQVENPAENPAPAGGSWNGYMRLAIAQLTRCEAIYLLPGWAKSKGARLERLIAQEFGLQRMYHPDEWADMQAIKNACEKAAAQGMRVAMLDDGPVFFSMEGDHAAINFDELNCPACGGSGHVGDVAADHIADAGKMVAAVVVGPWKDHMTAQMVGELTEVAKKYHGAQQLRERIAGVIRPLADRVKIEEAAGTEVKA